MKKTRRSLRFKLTLLLTVVAVVPIVVFSAARYERRTKELTRELHSILKEAAVTQVSEISADEVLTISNEGNGSKTYNEVRKKLRKMIGLYGEKISEAYLLVPTANENIMKFLVDGDANENTAAKFMEDYDVTGQTQLKEGLIAPSVDKDFTVDKWGYWLSGYAPIRNADGVAVAILGLDMKVSGVQELKRELLISFCIYILVTIFLSIIIASLVASTISKPIYALIEGVKQISEKNYGESIKLTRNDELGDLIEIFNKLSNKLKEMDKLKSSFLAVVSHELRTPISPIRLCIENIGLQPALNESSKKMLVTMEKQINKLNDMIDEVLDFALLEVKVIEIKKVPTTIPPLIEDTAKHISETVKNKEISFKFELKENLPVVLVDGKYIAKVLRILMENAVKFSTEKAEVLVSVKNASPDSVEIAVVDKGIGFDSKHASSIFDSFHQEEDFLTREHGGLGVGLAIAKRIVEAHGGTISAESAGAGYGSTFKVKLSIL